MLMPPQKSSSSQPDFDFIMKSEPKPKRKLSLPKLPKWAMLAVVGFFLLFLIIIIGSLFSGGGNTPRLTKVIASATEIARVSTDAAQQSTSTDIKNIAATTSSALNSQQQQVTAYLISKKVKVNTKKTITGLPSDIDSRLITAAQNNAYDQTYISYLKNSLTTYQQTLQEAFKNASAASKPMLSEAYTSVGVLLNSSQLK